MASSSWKSAFKDKNAGGAPSARWMSSAFKYDGSAQVLSGVMARVNPPVVLDEDSKRVRQTATLMLSDEAKAVSSGGELTAALVEVLSAKKWCCGDGPCFRWRQRVGG